MTHLAVSAPSTLSRSRHRGGLPTFVGLAIPKGERQMFKEITYNRRRFLGTAVMTIAAAELGMVGCADAQFSKMMPATNLAIQALYICVVSMAELVKVMKLVYPIPMRFTVGSSRFFGLVFHHRSYRYM
jgi:hypothetical protein